MASDDPTTPQPLTADREPQPTDGPDWHADYAAWRDRQRPRLEDQLQNAGEVRRERDELRATVEQLQAEGTQRVREMDDLRMAEIKKLRAEVDRLTADLAQRPVIYARTCDDCPGGTDWQQRAEQAEADLAHTTSQRDAADLCIDAAHEALVEKAWALDIDSLRAIVTEGLSAGRGRSRLHRQLDELRIARAAQPQEGTP